MIKQQWTYMLNSLPSLSLANIFFFKISSLMSSKKAHRWPRGLSRGVPFVQAASHT